MRAEARCPQEIVPMKIRASLTLLAALCLAQPAFAQLKPHTDYDFSASVSSVTTVKVHANMIDYYLEGIRATWVSSNEAAKKLGHIQDYGVYVSELPNSGNFNVVLTVTYKSGADLEPSKERYEAFMKEWGTANEKMSEEKVKAYPDIRDITGEYRLRKITFK
jgi:hypothetical protein